MNGVKASQVNVDTRRFEFANGKAPRGIGNWAFVFGGDTEPQFCPGPHKYGDAKRWAILVAVDRGCYDVTLCS
jgi:hypothetical protein